MRRRLLSEDRSARAHEGLVSLQLLAKNVPYGTALMVSKSSPCGTGSSATTNADHRLESSGEGGLEVWVRCDCLGGSGYGVLLVIVCLMQERKIMMEAFSKVAFVEGLMAGCAIVKQLTAPRDWLRANRLRQTEVQAHG